MTHKTDKPFKLNKKLAGVVQAMNEPKTAEQIPAVNLCNVCKNKGDSGEFCSNAFKQNVERTYCEFFNLLIKDCTRCKSQIKREYAKGIFERIGEDVIEPIVNFYIYKEVDRKRAIDLWQQFIRRHK